jgi:hypothetical protein
LARRHQERGHEAACLRLLGQIASRREPRDVEGAESDYRQALALADELGMRPLAAQCHAHLAALLEQVPRPEQARAHQAAAETMYRDMGIRA